MLYATTTYGGQSGQGTVFSLTPPTASGDPWTETVLYSFSGRDGESPSGVLVFGANGALFGTTRLGGRNNAGTVFSLTPPEAIGSQWTETVLHSFKGFPDGAYPEGGLTLFNGVLYGTTVEGGNQHLEFGGAGTVFSLVP